jgi:RecG-like helicase
VAGDRGEKPSRLRGLWSRFSSPLEEQDAADLRTTSERLGVFPVGAAPERRRVTVHGSIRSVTMRPRSDTTAVEADVYDGTGSVTLVFLGRQRIPGVDCGRTLSATGLVSEHEGRRVMYNPRYELDPPSDG